MPEKRHLVENGVTPFEERFCQEYLIDLNGAAAARRAGSKAKSPNHVAYHLLQKEHVQKRLKELMDERAKRTQIEADDVLRELALMGFANMMDYVVVREDGTATVDLSRLEREKAAAIQEVFITAGIEKTQDGETPVNRIRFKLADKTRALELIGKHLGMFVEKLDVNVKGRIALTELLGDESEGQ